MIEVLQENWELIKENLKQECDLTVVSYDTWIKPLEILSVEGNTVKITVKEENANMFVDYLTRKFQTFFQVVIANTTGFVCNVEFVSPSKQNTAAQTIQKKDNLTLASMNANLNPRYTFETFVVGANNKFAHAASLAVAESPAERYNPLFIYGGVGLGKTHILHAIGNYIKQYNPNLNVMYVTCEQFANDYIESLGSAAKNKAVLEFRTKYRNLDVLMVDDIQFISKKTSTQEEFFHTFNELYQNNKQIIITSDRPPKDIDTLADRLRSRFTSGLIQDIQQPDLETRIAILRKKCQIEKYVIDDDVIDFIAERINTNIRELEGMLSKVYFLANLSNKHSATMEEALEAFNGQLEEDKNEGLSPDDIIDTVCRYFDITRQDIVGKKKSKDVVEPRMIAIYLISEILEIPLVSIGKIFGGRDHTTIMHSRDKISDELKTSHKVQSFVSEIKKMLKGG